MYIIHTCRINGSFHENVIWMIAEMRLFLTGHGTPVPPVNPPARRHRSEAHRFPRWPPSR